MTPCRKIKDEVYISWVGDLGWCRMMDVYIVQDVSKADSYIVAVLDAPPSDAVLVRLGPLMDGGGLKVTRYWTHYPLYRTAELDPAQADAVAASPCFWDQTVDDQALDTLFCPQHLDLIRYCAPGARDDSPEGNG